MVIYPGGPIRILSFTDRYQVLDTRIPSQPGAGKIKKNFGTMQFDISSPGVGKKNNINPSHSFT